jgi:molecular chaperone IbpA
LTGRSGASGKQAGIKDRIENGLLQIELVREIPEAMKPRRIAIGSGTDNKKTIDHRRAA